MIASSLLRTAVAAQKQDLYVVFRAVEAVLLGRKHKRPHACATCGLLVGGPVDGFVTAAGEGAGAAVSKGEA
jgi:hypothetical protein